MSKERKNKQLGMNVGTATNRLKKDILFSLVKKAEEDTCFQCGEPIEDIKDFSVEHKEPWLDSEDPLGLFFDLDNVAFSHLSCNTGAARKTKSSPEKKRSDNAASHRRNYSTDKRREKFERTGH